MKKIILTLALIMGIGITSIFVTSVVANAYEESTLIEGVQEKVAKDGQWQGDWNSQHYFKDERSLINEWLYYNSNWYYFDSAGRMLSNKVEKIEDKAYLFYENGAMTAKSGWIKSNCIGCFYQFYGNGDGTAKSREWFYENGEWYYFMRNQESHSYYFGGQMVRDASEYIDGKVYTFYGKGVRANPYQEN